MNGFFLLAAGWLLTSSGTTSYLHENPSVRHTALWLVLVAHVLYSLIALRAFGLSRSTTRLLRDLDYMPRQYYANHCIRPMTIGMWYLTNLIVTGGIVLALLTMG